LNLPGPVLQKIFHDNAIHWIPGIAVNWTTVLVVNEAVQFELHPMAAGLLFTTPLPFPEN